MLIKSILSICKTKKIGLKMNFKTSNTCERSSLGDGAATANSRGLKDVIIFYFPCISLIGLLGNLSRRNFRRLWAI